MALALFDRVQETSTTAGTGSIILAGAVSGFQSFAVVGNGNTCYYTIVDGSAWEVGVGTYSTAGPTLARTTILSNSNGNTSPLTLTANSKSVFLTYPASKSVNLNESGNVSPLGTVVSGIWNGTTIGVAYGGTGVTASSGANSVVLRDSNQNVAVNRVNQANTNTTAAGGTTALTAASSYIHTLVGTGGQTYSLPDATTLTTGVAFVFNNLATGTLTIANYAGTTIGTIPSGGAGAVFLTLNSTVGGTWDLHAYLPEGVTFGTNAFNLGTSIISGGTWQGGTIQTGYGGTGLTSYTSGGAVYANSTTTLTSGTLPVTAGGTGATTAAGAQSSLNVPSTTGSGASGTWGINISGNAATATSATTATTATNQSGGTVNATTGAFSQNITVGTGTAVDPSNVSGFAAGQITEGTTGFSAPGIIVGSGAGQHGAIVYGANTMYFGTENGSDNTMNTRATLSSAGAFNTTGAITQNGSQVLTAANYNSYAPTLTGGGASGTWGINITGSAGSAGSASTASRVTGGNLNPAGIAFNNALVSAGGSNRVVTFDGNGNVPSVWWSSGSRAYGAIDAQDPGLTFWANNGSSWQQQMAVNYGNVTINTDIRSPIFYDSNNTAYYVDPASTSNLVGLTVANTISGSITGNSASVAGLVPAQFYNNMGNNHTTYTNFNSVPGFGNYYLQNSTNGPTGIAGNQFYGFTLGLGNDYPLSLYGSQIYYPRRAQNSETYLYVRDIEGGSWTSWVKIRAGYADTAGSVSSISATTSTGIQSSYSTTINTTTPGLANYGVVFSGPAISDYAQGITWGWSGTNAQAGIYVQSSGAYGTKMYFGTTDSFATGSKTSMSIDHVGNVNLPRGTFSNGSVWINNGANFNAYNENIRLFNAPNGVSVIGFSASGTSGTPTTSILGFSDRWEVRFGDGWQQRTYNGFVEAAGSFRAPIFYDSNDTGYYLNPNGASNIGSWTSNSNVNLQRGSSTAVYQTIENTDSGGTYTYFHLNQSGGGNGYLIKNRATGNSVSNQSLYLWNDPGPIEFVPNGNPAVRTTISTGGSMTVATDIRAPIFYDSNDTGYYIDPNSTSNTALRIRGGALHGPNPTWGQYLYVGTDGNSDANTATVAVTNGNLHLDARNGYIMYLNNYATSSYTIVAQSCRSPIFYDSNDTSYYVDPNSTSFLYRGRYGPFAGSQSGNTSALEIMNAGGTGDANLANITFHCQSYYGTSLHLRADGYFGVGGWSATTWRWYTYLVNGDMTAAGNVTAYSDPRLKTEITPIQSALSIIQQLNGVRFKWIESSVIGHPGEYDYGVLADEVQKVLPELVSDSMYEAPEGDKYKTVAYDKFAPILIESVKELAKYVTALEQRIAQLEARL